MRTSSGLFTLCDFEVTFFVAKNWMKIFNEFGKNFAFKVVDIFNTVLRTICKEIFF